MDPKPYDCTIYAIPPCTYTVSGRRGNVHLLETNGPWEDVTDLMSEDNTALWSQVASAINDGGAAKCEVLCRCEGGISWEDEKYQIRGIFGGGRRGEWTDCVRVAKNCWAPLAGFHTRDSVCGIPTEHMRAFVKALNTLGYTTVQCKVSGTSAVAKQLKKEITVKYSKHAPLAWFERKFTSSGEFKTDVQALPCRRGVQWRKCKLYVL